MKAIGLDIVATDRIRRALDRFGRRFAERLLGPDELVVFDRRKDRPLFLAGRFAAKEALIKALGRFLTDRPAFRHIQIVNDPDGQPQVHLADELRVRLAGHRCLVSITHEKTNSAAVVIIVEES